MTDGEGPAGTEEIIARQAGELEQLRQQLANETFVRELRAALALGATAATLSAPVAQTPLLEAIVETAAQVITARAASLFLVDEEAGELIVEVALGEKGEKIKNLRLPLGHGIAGLVAQSGQPLAIAEARNDPRHARDIADIVGYRPETILCVPLISDERVIGVLELLDKEGGMSFSANDMAVLGLFANQVTVAIEQAHSHRDLAALVTRALASWSGISDDRRGDLEEGARAVAVQMEGEDPLYHEALELARLVQGIVSRGEHEANACRTILRAFADYATRSETSTGLGVWF